jgi:fatty aldehyde-generating acyl-ACP reductase
MEDSFAFIIHPIDPKRDVSRKYPALGKLPVWLIDFLSLFFPPVYISEIQNIQSAANGRTLHGWFVACPPHPNPDDESAASGCLQKNHSKPAVWPKS